LFVIVVAWSRQISKSHQVKRRDFAHAFAHSAGPDIHSVITLKEKQKDQKIRPAAGEGAARQSEV